MRVLQINSVCGIRSTGRIATDIYHTLKEQGHECRIAYGRENTLNICEEDTIRIGSDAGVMLHATLSRLSDKTGFYSKKATQKLIREIDAYSPDIVQLHNLHGYYINIEVLFGYLAKKNLPVFWTMHDCWAFTGHCAYYDFAGCDRWRTGCFDCPQKKEYPSSLFLDSSKSNYEEKKELFTGVPNLNLICISDWIADQARTSFLKEKNILTIHNGIDTELFKPTGSSFRERHGIGTKRMLLGVASVWDRRKGFDTFLELASRISNDEVLVMVGLSEEQIKMLPDNIIGIRRTNSVEELAQIYTAADVFVNPTMEEGLGLVNLEAQACGTPVVTYNTGGSPECISENSGAVVPKGDIDALLEAARCIECDKDEIVFWAKNFDKRKKYKEYIELYSGSLK